MDMFVEYLNAQRQIKGTRWSELKRRLKNAYSNEVSAYVVYGWVFGENIPPFTGTEYEIRRLIGYLFALERHSDAHFLNLGKAMKLHNRSEREFEQVINYSIDKLINYIHFKAGIFKEINLLELSNDLFHWEYQKNADEKDYIINKWMRSYALNGGGA